jgi:hypothetical protein
MLRVKSIKKMTQIRLSYIESSVMVAGESGSNNTTMTARERTVNTRMKML